MTGLTFNGARILSDRDMGECEELAMDSYARGGITIQEALRVEARCLEQAWQDALDQAHDEWWEASAPERWEDYGYPDVAWPKAA